MYSSWSNVFLVVSYSQLLYSRTVPEDSTKFFFCYSCYVSCLAETRSQVPSNLFNYFFFSITSVYCFTHRTAVTFGKEF